MAKCFKQIYSRIGESFVGDNGFDYCGLSQYRYKEEDKLILLPCLHQFDEKCASKYAVLCNNPKIVQLLAIHIIVSSIRSCTCNQK